MVINSLSFLLFFITFFFVYYLLQRYREAQNYMLLLFSFISYCYAGINLVIVLYGSIVVTYLFGILIYRLKFKNSGYSRILLILGISLCLLPLGYFKYFNFFIEQVLKVLNLFQLHSSLSSLQLLLPLGISFYTFKQLSYLIEIYWGRIPASYNLVSFINYVSFFPTIACGPIDRPNTLIPQFQKQRYFNYNLAADGTKQVLWGLFKKVVVADNISAIVDQTWATFTAGNGLVLLISAVLYSIEIYADFSGYSDMAIGVSKILGFRIVRNFNFPYFSRNMSEFWRKWHISLTSWFMDYIYIPLGGSRCSRWRHLSNLLIVFIVSGFWHGANWNFLFWGFFHGLLLVSLVLIGGKKYKDIVAKNRTLPSFVEFLKMFSVFFLSTIGWIFFRAPGLKEAVNYIKCIFINSWSITEDFNYRLLFFICLMIVLEWFSREKEHPFQSHYNILLQWIFYSIVCISIIFYQGDNVGFIYFMF